MPNSLKIAFAGAKLNSDIYDFLALKFENTVTFFVDVKLDDTKDLVLQWANYDAVMFIQGDDANIDCWIGHPHFRYIKNDENIKKSIKNEIKCLVNNIELEKKWLIKMPNIANLSKYKIRKIDIEQKYLLSSTGSHRIRKRGFNGSFSYFETLKIRVSGDKAKEFESNITEEKYLELSKLSNPNKNAIIKNRYCLLYEGQYFELDVFPFWQDKALIELELCKRKQEQFVKLPPEIEIIKDVSTDKEYKNNYLASLKL